MTRGDHTSPALDLEFDIEGMTCSACVRHVEEAINELEGARASVDLAAGRATVAGLDEQDVARVVVVVGEAGYAARERRGQGEAPQ